MKTNLPNFLVVSGTGRNVGKTTLVCEILKRFAPENRIAGVKITNHFHEIDQKTTSIIAQNETYIILEERNSSGLKDTSRYLQDGADSSFLIMYTEGSLSKAFEAFSHQINIQNGLFIVESAAILEIIYPAAHILQTTDNQNLGQLNYDVVSFFAENSLPDFDFSQISSRGNQWILK